MSYIRKFCSSWLLVASKWIIGVQLQIKSVLSFLEDYVLTHEVDIFYEKPHVCVCDFARFRHFIFEFLVFSDKNTTKPGEKCGGRPYKSSSRLLHLHLAKPIKTHKLCGAGPS